ncbi:MAG: hypothetical protein ABR906_07940 [Terracidiphilus sp.]|jgi:hypothetical protein
MKRRIGIVVIALLICCGSARTFAQADTLAPKASETKIEVAPTTYRLTYTITEMEGVKRIGVQHLALTLNVDPENKYRNCRVRLGSKVPIATVSKNAETPGATEIQYQDVGLNINAHLREFTTGVEVYSNLEQSSISEEQTGVYKFNPVIRQATLDNTSLLTPGKPMLIGSLDIPGSTRHLDIEVVIELVR